MHLGLKITHNPCTINTLHICILSLQVSLKLKCAWWWTACSRFPNLLIDLNGSCGVDWFSWLYCKPTITNKHCANGNALFLNCSQKLHIVEDHFKVDTSLERKNIKNQSSCLNLCDYNNLEKVWPSDMPPHKLFNGNVYLKRHLEFRLNSWVSVMWLWCGKGAQIPGGQEVEI